MKLTVYDKSNSHPALTYKGKRIITVCRDGSMYLSIFMKYCNRSLTFFLLHC